MERHNEEADVQLCQCPQPEAGLKEQLLIKPQEQGAPITVASFPAISAICQMMEQVLVEGQGSLCQKIGASPGQ